MVPAPLVADKGMCRRAKPQVRDVLPVLLIVAAGPPFPPPHPIPLLQSGESVG